MEPRANYLTVGLFVLGLATALVLTILWLSASGQAERSTYLVYLNESVTGLSVQAPVRFNGVDVGNVTDVSLNPKNPQQVRLELSINNGTPITQSTRAILQTQGITGVMYVGLQAGATNAPALEKSAGEDYPVITSQPSLLMQVDAAVRQMATGFQDVSGNVQQLLNAKNQAAIQQSLANLAKITDSLASSNGGVENLTATLQNFSQQVLPSMLQTLNRLTSVLAEIEPTARNLKDNPSVLIRGSAPAALGPGE